MATRRKQAPEVTTETTTATATATATPTRQRKARAATTRPAITETAGALPEDHRLVVLRSALAERQANEAAIEQMEKARAKTPLALVLQVISCHFAVEHWVQGRTAPQYSWPTRSCYQGKTTPDQECRPCQYCKILTLGNDANTAPHEKRYPEHGLVIPIPDEETADALASAIKDDLRLAPLRRVRHEIEAIERAIALLESQQQQAQRHAVELQQQGRLAPQINR